MTDSKVEENERVSQARSLLMRLAESSAPSGTATGWKPAWSSAVLEATVERVLSAPGARVSDLFQALWELLASAPLTQTMANFLRDIVVLCFTRYRSLYENDDLAWMASSMAGCSEAQAYLSLHALPEELLNGCQSTILSSLKDGAFHAEAMKMLAVD